MRARRWTATAAAAGVLARGLGGCGSDDEEPREGVRVEELTGDASGAFDLDEVEAGERITLRVEVAKVLSPDSFLAPPKDTAGEPLLVLAESHGAEVGQELQVSGIARVFSYDEQAREHELAAESAYAEYDNELVLVADLDDEDLPLDDQ